jgi:hypothetical protein
VAPPCVGRGRRIVFDASGKGPLLNFWCPYFCVILSAAKDLDGRSDDRRQSRTVLLLLRIRCVAHPRNDAASEGAEVQILRSAIQNETGILRSLPGFGTERMNLQPLSSRDLDRSVVAIESPILLHFEIKIVTTRR